MSMMSLDEFEAEALSLAPEFDHPYVVLNTGQAIANIRKFHEDAGRHGKRVRPHLKGHKTLRLAQEQLAAGAVGFEVSRIREIEWYLSSGLSADFVLSWTHFKPENWRRVALCNDRGSSVSADVDSLELARGYDDAARALGTVVGLRLQVDTGLRGVPVAECQATAEAIARLKNVRLVGITGYRSIYERDEGRNWTPFDVIGFQEGELLSEVAGRIAGVLGRELPVMCGSTAVASGTVRSAGVQEVAGASYVLGDWGLAQLGIMPVTEVAVGVVARVLECRGDELLLDAGADVFGRWDPYPGIGEPVVAASPDGSVTVVAMEAEVSTARSTTPRRWSVGDAVFLLPAQGSELVNVPGEYVALGDGVEKLPRLSTGYFHEDDPAI